MLTLDDWFHGGQSFIICLNNGSTRPPARPPESTVLKCLWLWYLSWMMSYDDLIHANSYDVRPSCLLTSFRRSIPWNLHRQRCLDEVSRCENGIGLLLGTASTVDYPSVSVEICSSVAGVVSRPLAAGLRQFNTRWRFIITLVTAAVSDELCIIWHFRIQPS